MSVAGLALHPFTAPRDLPEALGLLAERAARNQKTVLLAGGTDWFVERHVAPPETEGTLPLVVDVSRLEMLRRISLDGDSLGGDTPGQSDFHFSHQLASRSCIAASKSAPREV